MKSIFLALVIGVFFVVPSMGFVHAGSGDDPVTIGLPSPPLDEETSEDDENDAEESEEGGQEEESGSQSDEGGDEGDGQPSGN